MRNLSDKFLQLIIRDLNSQDLNMDCSCTLMYLIKTVTWLSLARTTKHLKIVLETLPVTWVFHAVADRVNQCLSSLGNQYWMTLANHRAKEQLSMSVCFVCSYKQWTTLPHLWHLDLRNEKVGLECIWQQDLQPFIAYIAQSLFWWVFEDLTVTVVITEWFRRLRGEWEFPILNCTWDPGMTTVRTSWNCFHTARAAWNVQSWNKRGRR